MKNRCDYFWLLLVIFFLTESCASPSPSNQILEVMVDYIEILRSAHINSQRDIDELKEKIDSITKVKEEIKILELQMMKEMSQEEIEEYSLMMMEKMERSGIMEISEQESDRIKKEAEKAGVIIDFPL